MKALVNEEVCDEILKAIVHRKELSVSKLMTDHYAGLNIPQLNSKLIRVHWPKLLKTSHERLVNHDCVQLLKDIIFCVPDGHDAQWLCSKHWETIKHVGQVAV